MNIIDIAKAISIDTESYKFTGIRDGEKLHEEMISAADALNTYELDDFYVIKNPFDDNLPEYLATSKQVADNFSYSSDKNPQQMSIDELSIWINQNLSSNGFKSLL